MSRKKHIPLDPNLVNYIRKIEYSQLGGVNPEIKLEMKNNNLVKISFCFYLEESVSQDDWQINLVPSFLPTFHWAPHLTPSDTHIIDQHSFRSPSLIISNQNKLVALIPDLDIMSKDTYVRWYLDLNAVENKLTLGMSDYQVTEHVLYQRKPGAVYPKGKIEIGFYLMIYDSQEQIANPFRPVLHFLWDNWGRKLYKLGLPLKANLDCYVDYTYQWAFKNWVKNIWQEFEIEGKRVGAPDFIVNVTQSPNYDGPVNERETRSIWNQAWFSSLRSASGLYRYAKDCNNEELLNKALLTKELALCAPRLKGFFPTVIATEMEEVEVNGKFIKRSKGWNTYYWGNSNRNPFSQEIKHAPYHVLDMSWTALLMLRWYEELERDERLLSFAVEYADSLVSIQDNKGYFPAWLDKKSLEPLMELKNSPETSLSVTFLLSLYQLSGDKKYRTAAILAMDIICEEVIMDGKWEDFETYWSCSQYGNKLLVGKKVSRNNMYKQCNFSMYWTAEALYECYQLTSNDLYLEMGIRCLDEMLMTQASWQPPYLPIDTIGGFGVMNADGEWNDARQSLFAEIIIKFGKELENMEYIQRGLAALRSSFTMMYCPENNKTRKQWENRWSFFNEKDFGFMMENYGHDGKVDSKGLGIGEFTIYDWGNGAASESYLRIKEHFGSEFVERLD